MAPEKLPLELEDEILIRTRPTSLSRFRTVCKRWNTLSNAKSFVVKNFHLSCARPEFMIHTEFQTYSLSINLEDHDPRVIQRELTFDNPVALASSQTHVILSECNGFLLCGTNDRAAVMNPLLKQARWIEPFTKQFVFCGLGYDSRMPEKSYKVVGYSYDIVQRHPRIAIYEFANNAWKYIDQELSIRLQGFHHNVSLNGNLYWIAYKDNTRECCILCFDCSMEIFKHKCVLPCSENSFCSIHVLGVFKGERFSVLEQCTRNEKIRVWVTKNKIDDIGEGEAALWMKFMTVSIPNINQLRCYPTYFVEETYVKSLVICYNDESGKASIYIAKGDVSKRIRLAYKVYRLGQRITYVPSLIPIPM